MLFLKPDKQHESLHSAANKEPMTRLASSTGLISIGNINLGYITGES
jgi:hypothetical protein